MFDKTFVNVIEGGGVVAIGERGVGDFSFGKLTVIFFIFQNFVYLIPTQRAAGGGSPLKVTPGRAPATTTAVTKSSSDSS